ncbi:uncharacterized protein PRCAT00005961001 [Priceomyces carsonii]|uniref:uncharacterized protein n=1 Tax=Priceomyces carsonii TaxID=28549 RepID=UPI002ED9CE55|nr:unnamed protein product [Priceomyces carsonii]
MSKLPPGSEDKPEHGPSLELHDENNDIYNDGDGEGAEEDEFSSEEPMDYFVPGGQKENIDERTGHRVPLIGRRFSRTDASSIVGGESVVDLTENKDIREQKGPKPAKVPQDVQDDSQKVFSFSLPFGGLSTIRSKILSFKFEPYLPIISPSHDDIKDDIRDKLQRQQLISTIEEAQYFKHFKGTDDARLRAVKKSLTSNINEMLPEFIHKRTKEDWEAIYDDIDGNIVIMGGYRGSILRDAKTHKRVWIPIKAGFHLRKINLLLGPTKDDELNASRFIYPDGVLKNIGPIDICKRLIKKLESNPNTNVKEFGYDWRLSGELLSEELVKFLTEIYNETGKPTLVIAHSMGGIIAHGALQKNPKLFRSIVYVGLPSECLNILGPIRFGDSVILSDKILTFETNFMMRSSFLFLPLSGRVFVNPETHEHYDLDYFNPDTWVEFNLNPLVSKKRKLMEQNKSPNLQLPESGGSFPSINSISSKFRIYRSKSLSRKHKPADLESSLSSNLASTSSLKSESPPLLSPSNGQSDESNLSFSFTFKQAYNYLKETLALTKKFILGLDYREDLACEYPPLAIVYGNRVPSVRGSCVHSLEDIKQGNYYQFYYGHGDGVVHQKWLMPERKGFKFYDHETSEGEIVGKFPSKCGHVNLMTDFKAMGLALGAVFEAEKKWDEKKRKQKHNRLLKLRDHTSSPDSCDTLT